MFGCGRTGASAPEQVDEPSGTERSPRCSLDQDEEISASVVIE